MSKQTDKTKNKKNTKLENDYLFQTKTIITETEFKRFQKFYLNKFKNSIIPKLVIALLAIIALILNIIKGNTYIVVLVIIFIIAYPIIFSLTINRQIKKIYNNNIKINVLEEELTFYNTYFESKSKHNQCRVEYQDVYRFCETKTNCYIFVSTNQAFIILKKNVSDIDKFLTFMREKTNYKRYR